MGNGRSQRPWQSLYFLPLPQKQGSLRPGVFSTRTGVVTPPPSATAHRRLPASSSLDASGCTTRGASPAAPPSPGPGRRPPSTAGCGGAAAAPSSATTCEVEDVADEVVLDLAHHRLEHVEALALPLGERVLLAHRPEVDALAQVVHLVEVLAPVLVDHREHHATLDLAQVSAPIDCSFLVAARPRRRRGARRSCSTCCASSSCSRLSSSGSA